MRRPDAPLTEGAALSTVSALGLAATVAGIAMFGLFSFPKSDVMAIRLAWFLLLVFGAVGGFVLLSECTPQRWKSARELAPLMQVVRQSPHAIPRLLALPTIAAISVAPHPLAYLSILPGLALLAAVGLERREACVEANGRQGRAEPDE